MIRHVRSSVLALLIGSMLASAAKAELVLSQLVVDLAKPSEKRADIEIWNNSDERAYVVAEPSEIQNPGTPAERRVAEPDPERRGLLVSPARMILEPKQRKLIRIAAIGPGSDRERVYRVTVKPVTGELEAKETGLKLLVGYDVLVLLRPSVPQPNVVASRTGKSITFRNEGNASVELADGQQCDPARTHCVRVQGKRLYANAQWSTELPLAGPVDFSLVSSGQSVRKSY